MSIDIGIQLCRWARAWFKHTACAQAEIANRKRKVLDVEIDDVESVRAPPCMHTPRRTVRLFSVDAQTNLSGPCW